MIPNKSKRLLIQLCILIAIIVGSILSLYYSSKQLRKDLNNRLFPNVYIHGQAVGKMNKTEVYLAFLDLESKIQKKIIY